MKLDSQHKKIISNLSNKHDLTEKEILEIIESPFIFIRKEVKNIKLEGDETKEEFQKKIKNFNIPAIGKLYANYYNFKSINNGKKRINSNISKEK